MATTATRLEFRLRPESKELIEQAAQLLGMTVSEFANSRLVQLARAVIAEHNLTRLTNRDRDIFLAVLDGDSKPNAALRKAFREVKRS
jgi:uncharacterized protein (DUF1778 family)